jgi:hypothetical protein
MLSIIGRLVKGKPSTMENPISGRIPLVLVTFANILKKGQDSNSVLAI